MNHLSRAAATVALALALAGCGGSAKKAADNKATLPPAPVDVLYNNGIDAVNAGRFQTAGDQFKSVEENYPYSTWAAKAQLMQGYTEYRQQNYTEALATLDRYIQLHPVSADVGYATYLRALCYYEQIEDVQRDQSNTVAAIAALRRVVDRFPGTAYARDARLKIDLARDHLAGHEMAIGLYYEHQHLYEAAIGRFQRVVQDYQTTNHVAEALARLVEIYLRLGMRPEAIKTAAVLGYNYPGSSWYAGTYAVLSRDGLLKGMPPPKQGVAGGFFSHTLGWLF